MFLIYVFFMASILVSVNTAGDDVINCAEGFMDYDLLEQKASQISTNDGSASLSNNALSENNWYAMPSLTFTCSGSITGLLMGLDIGIYDNRTEYPSIALYNKLDAYRYTFVSNSVRSIMLDPEDFSSNGVYNYTLETPLAFSKGQILRVYQPYNSRVRLYYESIIGQSIDRIYGLLNGIIYKDTSGHYEDSRLLLLPLTDSPTCLSGFTSAENLNHKAKLITSVDNTYGITLGFDRIFKGITFNCDCHISHVIIGTQDNTTTTLNPPEMRIWRAENGIKYVQSGFVQLHYDDAVEDISTEHLRWYNLTTPLSVQQGDIMGLYHYQPGPTDNTIYYQQYSGPVNYDINFQPSGFNIYPLVSVIVIDG